MKQTILALMCMAAVMMFTACGGGNSKKKAADGKTKTACEAAFRCIGLTLDQVKPNYKYLDEDTLDMYHGRGRYEGSVVFFKADKSDVSREEFENYTRKIYGVTQKIADEGKVIHGFERKSALEKATAEWPLDEIFSQLGSASGTYEWRFRHNGEFMSMEVKLINAGKKYPARLKVRFCGALQKSLDDTRKDAEKALKDAL